MLVVVVEMLATEELEVKGAVTGSEELVVKRRWSAGVRLVVRRVSEEWRC